MVWVLVLVSGLLAIFTVHDNDTQGLRDLIIFHHMKKRATALVLCMQIIAYL